MLKNHMPWEEIDRSTVGQQATDACLEPATLHPSIAGTRDEARHNH